MTEAEQNRLIVENMQLVPAVAAGYRGRLDFDDLVAIGREGLVKAARSFDPSHGTKFATWARIKIGSEIATALDTGQAEWFPKDAPPPPGDGIYNEKIYEWNSWSRRGNAVAIVETWQELPATPEDLRQLYDDLEDKSGARLSEPQRKLIDMVFVDGVSIQQAAREKQQSYYRMCRTLQRALRIMAEEARSLACVA